MKAVQIIETFTDLISAQFAFTALSIQDGFIGGRVYPNDKNIPNGITTQCFFECDQDLPYGELYPNSPERVYLIMESQTKVLGIGNPYSQI